jgi:hypothetical protein
MTPVPVRLLAVLATTVFGCAGPCVLFPGGALEGAVAAAPESWAFTDDVKTIQLETRPGAPYSVNIWVIALGEHLYVHAGANRAAWVEHLEATRARGCASATRSTSSRPRASRSRPSSTASATPTSASTAAARATRTSPRPSEIYYDPYDFEIDTDPHPIWRRMRDEAPLYRNELRVLRAQPLRRRRGRARRLADLQLRQGHRARADPQRHEFPPGTILFEDPPPHDAHRAS